MGPSVSPRGLSLWWEQVVAAQPDEASPRPPLDGDTTADVAVVGAGLTGLWTAYYLTEADPSLDVLVLEQEVAGFGASGRAGGWCSASFALPADELARRHGQAAALALRAAMRDAVVEVGGVARVEGIECGFAYGGTVTLAGDAATLGRLRTLAADAARWGDEEHLLDPDGVATHVQAHGVLGGSWTPDCARVQPAALVRGLAQVVQSRDVRVAEQTRVLRISPRAVVTDRGTVRARWVVRATEAWTARLPGSRRAVVPMHALMIATEPLPAPVWAQIGLDRAETFVDGGAKACYGVRTPDDRLAVGGRWATYHAGSSVPVSGEGATRGHERLAGAMVDLFPAVAGHRITHRWGGPLALPSDGHPSVGLDTDTGIGWAGGYAGDGIATANLAGRTLADLVTGADSALVRLPWVGHRSPDWPPEPIRWAQITARAGATALTDRRVRRASPTAGPRGT